MTLVGNDSDRLLVIARQYSENRSPVLRLECDAITDAKLQHGRVRAYLAYKPQALHDAVIQIDEFSFG